MSIGHERNINYNTNNYKNICTLEQYVTTTFLLRVININICSKRLSSTRHERNVPRTL